MAKRCDLPLIARVLCLLALFGYAHCADFFYVEGKVYCDTCRIAFETSVSEFIPGSRVRLECKDREGGHITYSVSDETDSTGTYQIKVEGEHEEEICEVVLVQSGRPDCKEVLAGRDRARILLSSNNGIEDSTRFANSLGFLKDKPIASCPKVLAKMGLLPSAMMP
ncbi:hypothetical protein Sjap_006150 [Stephania japonica]|uniref:Uncharacterized protein n=1 Tax=Stephania japonica TaxID=461633 RepID=A0AAP0K5E0_9MAGN